MAHLFIKKLTRLITTVTLESLLEQTPQHFSTQITEVRGLVVMYSETMWPRTQLVNRHLTCKSLHNCVSLLHNLLEA